MPYIVKANGAGPWQQGEILEDAVLKAHPFHEKFIRNGSVVEVSAADAAAAQKTHSGAAVADLDAQIAALQAQRSALLGGGPEPTAPGLVAYELDPAHPPTASEAAATRAAGDEVIQPLPGAPAVGAVVPTEPSPAARGAKK